MKAKDTVMSRVEVNKLWKDIELGSSIPTFANYGEGHPTYKLLKAQAEITWDKAIKEVVEWLHQDIRREFPYGGEELVVFRANGEEWQAKLKEWGVSDE